MSTLSGFARHDSVVFYLCLYLSDTVLRESERIKVCYSSGARQYFFATAQIFVNVIKTLTNLAG